MLHCRPPRRHRAVHSRLLRLDVPHDLREGLGAAHHGGGGARREVRRWFFLRFWFWFWIWFWFFNRNIMDTLFMGGPTWRIHCFHRHGRKNVSIVSKRRDKPHIRLKNFPRIHPKTKFILTASAPSILPLPPSLPADAAPSPTRATPST